VVESAPGIEASGAQAVAADTNLLPITAANPASPGQTVTFYISGGGQLSPAGVDNGEQQAGFLVSQVTATVGGQLATVIGAGTSAVIGAEVSVMVPANAPAGSDAVILTVGLASTQSGISIAVN
jgi:uncharacterized protein (TIGR03437 family)